MYREFIVKPKGCGRYPATRQEMTEDDMNITLKKLLVGAVAATAFASASAVPVLEDAAGNHQASELWFFGRSVPTPFDNVYTFTVGATDLLTVAVSNESPSVFDISGGNVALYSNGGDLIFTNDGPAIDGFTFDASSTSYTFTNVVPGGYYYRVFGAIVGSGGGSYLLSSSLVPEPGTYALLLAGLGVMAFVAKRRRVV